MLALNQILNFKFHSSNVIFWEIVSENRHFQACHNLSHFFPETYGNPSQSFIHYTKPTTLYFEHLKYEPDRSTYAREEGGVKIVTDCRTRITYPLFAHEQLLL